MTCGVEVNIEANAELVWSLLTDAKGFSRWNSTITAIEGDIRASASGSMYLAQTARSRPGFRVSYPHGAWSGETVWPSFSKACAPLC